MQDRIKLAIDEIDAAMFVGDTFHDKDDREELNMYCERWLREIKRMDMEMTFDDGKL